MRKEADAFSAVRRNVYLKEKRFTSFIFWDEREVYISLEENTGIIEGRNAVIEAFRAGRTIDRLYVLDGCKDGPVMSIKREAAKQGTPIKYVAKERLDQMSETGRHQGVIGYDGGLRLCGGFGYTAEGERQGGGTLCFAFGRD